MRNGRANSHSTMSGKRYEKLLKGELSSKDYVRSLREQAKIDRAAVVPRTTRTDLARRTDAA